MHYMKPLGKKQHCETDARDSIASIQASFGKRKTTLTNDSPKPIVGRKSVAKKNSMRDSIKSSEKTQQSTGKRQFARSVMESNESFNVSKFSNPYLLNNSFMVDSARDKAAVVRESVEAPIIEEVDVNFEATLPKQKKAKKRVSTYMKLTKAFKMQAQSTEKVSTKPSKKKSRKQDVGPGLGRFSLL